MAYRRQRISQMPPKGANLEPTDLMEISELSGTGYITKSITGQEIINSASGGAIDLQQVTDNGATTTNPIEVTAGANESSTVSGTDIITENTFASTSAKLVNTGALALKTGAEESSLQNTNVTSPGVILEFPDKATGSYTIATTDDYVPYTGATTDVDLGEFELKAGQVELDQTPTGTAGVAVMRWNNTDGTVDLGLKGGNVTLQIGQEQVLRVVNKTATNVNLLEANYQAVRVTGAQGQRLKVDLAQATNDSLSAETIGLVTETINNNQEGFITTSGIVRGINTTGSLQSETWADGDVVYLSPTTAGNITNVKPTAPNHLVIIGYVISAHITQGSIFVKVDNGYELDELHNVLITTPLNNQSLVYETSSTLWKNKDLRIPSVQTVASSATVTPTSTNDIVTITAQAVALALANPTGTFVEGQSLIIRIKDNGTARAITYGANFRAIGVTAPTTTVANKTTYIGCIYNDTDTKFDIIGTCTEA